MKKHNALAHRLIDRQNDYPRFTTDWRVTADNNGTERDIRDQTEAEGVRMPTHAHRSPPVLRDPKLPVHRRQARDELLRSPGHAHRGQSLDARTKLIPSQPVASS